MDIAAVFAATSPIATTAQAEKLGQFHENTIATQMLPIALLRKAPCFRRRIGELVIKRRHRPQAPLVNHLP